MVNMTLGEAVNTIYISVWQRSTGNIDWHNFTKMTKDLGLCLRTHFVYMVCVCAEGEDRERRT